MMNFNEDQQWTLVQKTQWQGLAVLKLPRKIFLKQKYPPRLDFEIDLNETFWEGKYCSRNIAKIEEEWKGIIVAIQRFVETLEANGFQFSLGGAPVH